MMGLKKTEFIACLFWMGILSWKGAITMKILYAAPEKAWGGFLDLIRAELPEHHFEATGRFEVDSLRGYDVLIPTI